MGIYPDGREYEGEFTNGFMNGAGRMKWPNGRQYYGQWQGGEEHGIGTLTVGDKTRSGFWRRGEEIRVPTDNSKEATASEDGGSLFVPSMEDGHESPQQHHMPAEAAASEHGSRLFVPAMDNGHENPQQHHMPVEQNQDAGVEEEAKETIPV